MHPWWRQIPRPRGFDGRRLSDTIERWLEAERDQLFLWLPASLGLGITLWFLLPGPRQWIICLLALLAVAMAATALARYGRASRSLAIATLACAVGLMLVWWRAERVAAPVLARPVVTSVSGRIERMQALGARDLVRLTIATNDPALPRRVRVNIAEADAPEDIVAGATISVRARLMPPAPPSVPGAYDFSRVAWFDGIGATGRAFAPVTVTGDGRSGNGLRERLTAHIERRLPGSAGGIAAALATGDEGAIDSADTEAMRQAGLAHLLSVSGLHITAVVGATMLVVLKLLALSPWLALRVRLPLVAASAGAAAAVGYTLLTGAAVPTIRSCVAALLILAALAMGREAITLRLVAVGALIVLVIWPESLAGASFQLSFAAITAIIAFHEHPRIATFFGPHDEALSRRFARSLLSLLATGLVVELALMPIAIYHFHRAGIYGALANILAIPLTTFVIMPLEALALAFDPMGLGQPIWWLAGKAIGVLLVLAHTVADAPGAVLAIPPITMTAFGAMAVGGLWIALWRTRWRRLGGIPLIAGIIMVASTPKPDILITGDGRHVAVRTDEGLATLRDRSGDYTRAMLSENGGEIGELAMLSSLKGARCSRDLCVVDVIRASRTWRVLATRSVYPVPIASLIAACGAADIVVSDRTLPRGCRPSWLKLDRAGLARSGGVAITLAGGTAIPVHAPGDRHPWRDPPTIAPSTIAPTVSRSGGAVPKAYPARGRDRGDSAADRRHDWPDRAGSLRLPDGNI